MELNECNYLCPTAVRVHRQRTGRPVKKWPANEKRKTQTKTKTGTAHSHENTHSIQHNIARLLGASLCREKERAREREIVRRSERHHVSVMFCSSTGSAGREDSSPLDRLQHRPRDPRARESCFSRPLLFPFSPLASAFPDVYNRARRSAAAAGTALASHAARELFVPFAKYIRYKYLSFHARLTILQCCY